MSEENIRVFNKRRFSLQIDKERFPEIEILDNDFELASEDEKATFIEKAPSVSYWQDAWRRLKANKVAMVSLVFIIAVIIFAFLGPLFREGDYTTQFRGMENLHPNGRFPFGTDKLGRDLMLRTMYGTRVSLIVGVFASIIVLIIGTLYGSIAGYAGGRLTKIWKLNWKKEF